MSGIFSFSGRYRILHLTWFAFFWRTYTKQVSIGINNLVSFSQRPSKFGFTFVNGCGGSIWRLG